MKHVSDNISINFYRRRAHYETSPTVLYRAPAVGLAFHQSSEIIFLTVSGAQTRLGSIPGVVYH